MRGVHPALATSHTRTRAVEAAGFVIGHREHGHLGAGWWDRQEWPDRPGLIYRPTHPTAEFFLRAPAAHRELRLLLAASLTLIGGPAVVDISASRGGEAERSLGHVRIDWEDWAVFAVPCPCDPPAGAKGEGVIRFVLRTLTPAIPHRVLRNGDHRLLGVHVAAAHLC